MIIKGFKFGMILQLAIGPVSMYVFQTVIKYGAVKGLESVLGVVLADILFILLAILGIGSIINKSETRKTLLTVIGSSIMLFFGLSMVLGIFGINLLPSLTLNTNFEQNNLFLMSFLLTCSNPLTILFWAGVFSAKVGNENLTRSDIYFFGFGAALSTFTFLSLIAIIAAFLGLIVPISIIKLLNLGVGLLIMYVAARALYLSKKKHALKRMEG